MKSAFLAITFLASLSTQAQVVCRVRVEGKTAVQVESEVSGALQFNEADLTVIAQPVPGKPNRMQFTFLNQLPTKAAYVIAAFRGPRLQVKPRINGQQMSVSCLRK